MAIASLRVPISALPSAAGSQSWLGALNTAGGAALDQASENKSFNRLADQIGGAPVTAPQPGFLSRLFGAQAQPAVAQAAAIPAPAAQSQMAASSPAPAPSAIKDLVAQNVPADMQQYALNLIGKESSFNPSAVSPTGAKGLAQFTKGTGAKYGLVSDQGDIRADPVANIKALVALTNDNRTALTQALGRAPTDGELALAHQQGAQGAINLLSGKGVSAQNLAVNGVDPGTDPRAAAQKIMSYYGGAGGTPAQQAIEAQAPSSGYVDPAITTAYTQPNAQPQTAQPPLADGNAPMPSTPTAAPQQVAQAGPQTLAAGVTPIPRGGVSTAMIQSMLRDPNLRQAGLQLWQQNATGKTSDGWDFVTLPDGTFARANKQTGAIETVGQFAKPQEHVRVLSADEKKAAGLPATGAFQVDNSGKISEIGGGGVKVNVDSGTIPAGYQAVRDPAGNLLRYEPVPGGPADNTAKKAAQADGRETLTDTITNAAQRAREAVKNATVSTDGLVGRVAGAMSPGSNAAEVRRQVGVLKSNATIETLNAMRQQSPTGGALGAVSDAENAMLAAKAGALDPDSPNFARDLDDYERTLLRTVHGKEAGDKIFEQTRQKEPEAVQKTGDIPAPEEVDPSVWAVMTPEERKLWQR